MNGVAVIPLTTAILEKSKLELILGILQRRDSHKFFAEPVDREEVELYYDIIKEPMDFGTIRKKLNEGGYKTLEEFEHDVFLISSNAMLFNASGTIYYRQARAIRDLAKTLFHCLKTHPQNFEAEFSSRRKRSCRRIKAEVGICNSNSCNKRKSDEIASKGGNDERSHCFKAKRGGTYRPWTSCFKENESLPSAVCIGSKQLELAKDAGIGYIRSLMQFAKGLGRTATTVARRKVGLYIDLGLKACDANLNCQLKGLEEQMSAATSEPKGIRMAPSLKLLQKSVGGQTSGEKASTINNMSIKDAIRREIGQRCSKMEGRKFQANETNILGLDVATSFIEHVSDQRVGIHLNSSFPKHASGDGQSYIPATWNVNNPGMLSFSKIMQDATGLYSPIQVADFVSSDTRMQDFVHNRNAGGSMYSWFWPSQARTQSSCSQAIGYLNERNLYNVGEEERVHQNEGRVGRDGPSCRSKSEEGGLFTEWTEPLKLGLQPSFDGWIHQQPGVVHTNLLCQAGPSQRQGWKVTSPPGGQVRKGSSMYEYGSYQFPDPDPSQNCPQQGWALSPPDERFMKAPNIYYNEGFPHLGQGDLTIKGPPDNRQRQGWASSVPDRFYHNEKQPLVADDRVWPFGL